MPWFVLMLSVIFGFLAFTADVMRTAHAVSTLQFASQTAALAGYRGAFSADGTKLAGDIGGNTNQYLQNINSGQALNNAPAGPLDGVAQTPVLFAESDISIVPNPNDATDFFLQVKARRDKTDGLQMMFLPTLYAFGGAGLKAPASTLQSNPYRVTEAILQPATRIGAGPPAGGGQQNSQFLGYAAFPIAIGNTKFSAAAQQSLQNYTIDITSKTFSGTASDFKGAFVNLTASGGSTSYYGSGTGGAAVSQLIATLGYFQNGNVQTSMPPAAVERGASLTAFDTSDPSFQNQAAAIIQQINNLVKANPNRYYMLPVLAQDPSVGGANQVVGFARIRLLSAQQAGGNTTLSVALGPSAPMTNATIGTACATIPSLNGTVMPAATVPFNTRSYDLTSNGISKLPLGVVMAPALSPRQIQGGVL